MAHLFKTLRIGVFVIGLVGAREMKAIFWDWNGTLVDDVSMMLGVFNQVAVEFGGRSVDFDEYQEIYRHPVGGMYEDVGVDLGRTSLEAVAKRWHQLYIERVESVPLHEDALPVLTMCRERGYTQAVLSALEHNLLTESVERYGLIPFFHSVRGAAHSLGVGKIDVGTTLVEELGVEPRDLMIVGDSSHDAEVAQALGCRCILVSRGLESARRLAAHGFDVCPSLEAVGERL